MSTISAIYQKVRHRLNDDWAFGNEQEAQAWDFQSDECALRAKIDRYNQRMYKFRTGSSNSGSNENGGDSSIGQNVGADGEMSEFIPMDNSLFSCLNMEVKLSDDFVNNYEQWLNEEVFENKIDWDSLLDQTEDFNNNSKAKRAILF